MIENSRERLERIEDDNITKVRLHRSTSLSETSVDSHARLSSSRSNSTVFRSVSSPSHVDNSSNNILLTRQNQNIDNVDSTESGVHNIDVSLFESENIPNEADEAGRDEHEQLQPPQDLVHHQIGVVETSKEVISDVNDADIPGIGACVTIDIDGETLSQLEEMFGKIDERNSGKLLCEIWGNLT